MCWAAPTPAWPCAPGHTHQVTAQRCPHAGSIRHGGHPAVRRVRHVIQPTDELLQLVAKHLHNKSQLLLSQLPALLLTATQTRGVHLQLLLPEGSSGSIEHLHLFLKHLSEGLLLWDAVESPGASAPSEASSPASFCSSGARLCLRAVLLLRVQRAPQAAPVHPRYVPHTSQARLC